MNCVPSSIAMVLLAGWLACCRIALAGTDDFGWYFPPPGEGLEQQQKCTPREVGLSDALIDALHGKAKRWALWRHGYLVHVEGDWNKTQDVASLRKTWHAMTVGAAIQQKLIPTYCQPLREWVPSPGDERVTWWHLITQTSGLDYPHADHAEVGDPAPGDVWTYSDKNPRLLCNGLARVYGKSDFNDGYADVARAAYFDAIGMRGWSARPNQDGIRFHLDLEDMGRLGLLALARGRWQDQQIVPHWFVEELESKQTCGTRSIYNGPDDGNVSALHVRHDEFPQCPYGYMTWVNTDGDYYRGADRDWAWGAGAGGTYVLWNYRLGIVFAGVGVNTDPNQQGIPHIIEAGASEPNPRIRDTVGKWGRWEYVTTGIGSYRDPYSDVTLDVTLTRPDGRQVKWWGFYDGDRKWRIRFMPDQVGVWRYAAAMSDGSMGLQSGSFECIDSGLPGMLCVDESNPIWFGRRDFGPVQLRGLHVGDRFFAENWPHSRRVEFLEWVKQNDYNLLSIASHYLNRDAEGRGRGWQTPRLWPPNADEFQRLERMLDNLADRQISIFPFAGFFGQQSNYPMETSDQELYVRYVLSRLGAYPNMLFNVAGPEPNLKNSWMSHADVQRLGRFIRDLDPLDHPRSVHNRTGEDPYRNSDWTTYGTLQGPKTVDRTKLSRGLLESHHDNKPLLAQETLWSGNKYHPDYTENDLRKNAFVIVMSGATLVFGDMAGDSSSGFSGTLDLEHRRQSEHDIVKGVWDFFESEAIPFGRMRPRQDLVDSGHCLADSGQAYLVYLENGGDVQLNVADGDYRAIWVNARNTSERLDGGRTSKGAKWTAPDSMDWLLIVSRL